MGGQKYLDSVVRLYDFIAPKEKVEIMLNQHNTLKKYNISLKFKINV